MTEGPPFSTRRLEHAMKKRRDEPAVHMVAAAPDYQA